MVDEESKELTNVAIDYVAHVSETLADMLHKDGFNTDRQVSFIMAMFVGRMMQTHLIRLADNVSIDLARLHRDQFAKLIEDSRKWL